MIKPGKYNITAYQGATYDLNMTWTIGGTAVNLTNYTAAMQVRTAANSTATVFSLTNGSGITLGGTAGTIAVNISANAMGAATPGQYVYDLELNSGSAVTRLIQGTFQIQAEVTR
jgi:hypothetical protein